MLDFYTYLIKSYFKINARSFIQFLLKLLDQKNKKSPNIIQQSLNYNRSSPSFDNTNENFIIGLALNYSVEDLSNFVCSLRKVDKESRVILIVNADLDPAVVKYLDRNDIEYFPWVYKKYVDPHLLNSRFEIYSHIIQLLTNAESKIFLTDVRDVVFQKNIFDDVKFGENEITFFVESPFHLFKNCKVNSFWYLFAFGLKDYRKVKNKPVICAGTILGSRNAILKYLNNQIHISKWLLETKMGAHYLNTDQAIHNYIAYSCDFKCKLDSEYNLVYTVSNDVNSDFKFDAQLARIDEQIPAVVHQYDRHDELNIFFRSLHQDLK